MDVIGELTLKNYITASVHFPSTEHVQTNSFFATVGVPANGKRNVHPLTYISASIYA